MDFLKKEWKTIILAIFMMMMFIYLYIVNGQLEDLKQQNAKIISTFDSVESVVISSDAEINDMSKKVGKIESNVLFLIKRARRR